MTQEDKDLLLKDLCPRLPYNPLVEYKGEFYNVLGIAHGRLVLCKPFMSYTLNEHPLVEEVKPYLFPLSSMTEEQRIELYKVLGLGYESHYHLSKEWEDFNDSIDNNGLFLPASWVSDLNKMYNWLNKNHFDYQGLIPMGLAIDATGKNIY